MTEPKHWQEANFLSPKDIAGILSIHINTAYEIVNSIPHIKIGRTYRVAVPAFMKWIRDQERKNAT